VCINLCSGVEILQFAVGVSVESCCVSESSLGGSARGADYTVAEVLVYPVKACKGVSVSSAAISSTGWFLFLSLALQCYGVKHLS
jgi:hypothetical protein